MRNAVEGELQALESLAKDLRTRREQVRDMIDGLPENDEKQADAKADMTKRLKALT